ncbi:phosphatase PAP2 family protein [Dyella silvatica]|uniref:phosphatase PAP2 family protein n=1 Tax=Dyella silvatica TaxID=2992128 RepID=UPI00225C045A|nr:phosphatase PAP2 family protein [Dyella silvatica]
MEQTAEWISTHALTLWACLLVFALICGDMLWRVIRQQRQHTPPGQLAPMALPPKTCFALALFPLLSFVCLAYAVQTHSALTTFDTALAEQLRQHMPVPVLARIAQLTQTGNFVPLAIAASVICIGLLLLRQWRLAATWAIGLLGNVAIYGSLKGFFQRPRPLDGHGFISEPTWSFPSGHSSGSMVFYGGLAYVLMCLLPPRWHRTIIAAAVASITLIGISRIMLQVHYFSDVMAGYSIGLMWLLICVGVSERVRVRRLGQHA